MLKINSFSVFIKMVFFMAFFIYFIFKVFNFFYPGNYCDFMSGTAKLNSAEDIRLTKICANTLICEVGNVELEDIGNIKNEKQKTFTCLRKNKTGVWKW